MKVKKKTSFPVNFVTFKHHGKGNFGSTSYQYTKVENFLVISAATKQQPKALCKNTQYQYTKVKNFHVNFVDSNIQAKVM